MQCTACFPRLTGEKVRVKFEDKPPVFIHLTAYHRCTKESILEEVIEVITILGVPSDLIAFHCKDHAISAPTPPPPEEPVCHGFP